jgi:hypothetical protein
MNRTTTGAHARARTDLPPTASHRPPLCEMSPEEVGAWIQATRRALEQKKARERVYLDPRADRGIHTPTDDAFEQDQRLEADLRAMLDEMEASL